MADLPSKNDRLALGITTLERAIAWAALTLRRLTKVVTPTAIQQADIGNGYLTFAINLTFTNADATWSDSNWLGNIASLSSDPLPDPSPYTDPDPPDPLFPIPDPPESVDSLEKFLAWCLDQYEGGLRKQLTPSLVTITRNDTAAFIAQVSVPVDVDRRDRTGNLFASIDQVCFTCPSFLPGLPLPSFDQSGSVVALTGVSGVQSLSLFYSQSGELSASSNISGAQSSTGIFIQSGLVAAICNISGTQSIDILNTIKSFWRFEDNLNDSIGSRDLAGTASYVSSNPIDGKSVLPSGYLSADAISNLDSFTFAFWLRAVFSASVENPDTAYLTILKTQDTVISPSANDSFDAVALGIHEVNGVPWMRIGGEAEWSLTAGSNAFIQGLQSGTGWRLYVFSYGDGEAKIHCRDNAQTLTKTFLAQPANVNQFLKLSSVYPLDSLGYWDRVLDNQDIEKLWNDGVGIHDFISSDPYRDQIIYLENNITSTAEIPGDDFDFFGQDITVEAIIQTTQSTSYATLISRGGGSFGAGSWAFLINSRATGKVGVWWADFSPSEPALESTNPNISDGNPHHLAWVRSGNNHYLFIDGELSTNRPINNDFTSINAPVAIKFDRNFGGREYQGNLSVRVTLAARYLTSFNVPTSF